MTAQYTHNADINVQFVLQAQSVTHASFGYVMLIVPLTTNSLNGDRTMTFGSYKDAQAAQTAGYISTLTLAACAVGFSQIRVPTKIKVGYQNDNASVPGVKAFHAGTGAVDTVYEAFVAGTAGNAIEIALVPDSGAGVTIQVVGTAVFIHYHPTVSTITNINTAVAALSGANQIIDIKTAGTGATVLVAGDAQTISLTGGVNAVPTETYGDAYTAIALADPDFYGVCATSRTSSDQLSLSNAVTAAQATDRRMCFFQTGDGTLLTNSPSSDWVTLLATLREAPFWHDIATEWLDMAIACGKLSWDPDKYSVPFTGNMVGVAAYATPLTSTQIGHLNTNNVNWMGPFPGGTAFYINKGINGQGVQIKNIVTADWYTARLIERVGQYVSDKADAGQAIPEDVEGQQAMVMLAQAQWSAGVTTKHFTGASTFSAPTLSNSDISDGILDVIGGVQVLNGANQFNFDIIGTTSPVTT